ncbi:MAG: GNAT family N-acetyltransferase [Alphaproteobacteria bacterium]|nr:GNAT family N-acetyltransferase [Alphaproteobacteria bacterium]
MTIQTPTASIVGLRLRLAQSPAEIRAAQTLRYAVFYDELGAEMPFDHGREKIDVDDFDTICDHLLVISSGSTFNPDLAVEDGHVVGTYRLLLQHKTERGRGFYGEAEFELSSLLVRHTRLKFLELGRSCILPAYRGTPVVELLWQGIWNYVRENKIDVMIGCASFDGIDISPHIAALHFLTRDMTVPDQWQVRAQPGRAVDLGNKPVTMPDLKTLLTRLPPLIKGYLRLGSYFGRDAVIDRAFNTTDVLVVLPVANINPRYFARFGEPLVNR